MANEETSTEATPDSAKPAKLPKRARGASFPAMTLIDAVAMIKKIASYGSTHTNAAVASFLGHSTPNSGPYRSKIAALKDYGFLSGRGDDLAVTPLALEITHPGLDADVQASLRAAFMQCSLFQTVYSALPKGTDLQVAALANSAMHNHGVAPQAKDTFASVFVKSGVSAGLIVEVDTEHVRLSDGDAPTDVDVRSEDDDEPDLIAPAKGAIATPAPTSEATPAPSAGANTLVSHSWPIAGGSIRFTIESSKPLPAGAYSVIGTVIGEGDKLADMLGKPEVEVPVASGGDPE